MIKKYSAGKDYKVIAFVHACFSREEQQAIIKVISKKSREYNCKVIFFSTLSGFYSEDDSFAELKIFDTITVEKFDAIVLMSETFKVVEEQKKLVKRATDAGVPVIAIERPIEGCINVVFDYEEAFREIVKHMVEVHGYRDIRFMAGVPDNRFSEARVEVFKQVLEENQIPFQREHVYYGYFWDIPTIEAMDKLMEENPKLPEAIICANDTMAITVCGYLNKRGIRIPEDVAVSGFDGIEVAKYHQPRLLTSALDENVFADEVFKLINDENLSVGERNERAMVFNRIQPGGSCGCCGTRPEDASSRIIYMRSQMDRQMEYQMNLGQMVADYGDAEGMEIIQKVIPKQLDWTSYSDFWICSEKRLLIEDTPRYSSRKQEEQKDTYNVIHYKKKDKGAAIEYIERMPRRKLVPDIKKQLDNYCPMLVVGVPTPEDPNAYAVISMYEDHFWFTAYSGFVFHLRFILDMQRSKKALMQMYHIDALTGVLNRNGFYSVMKQIMEYSNIKNLTVISMDMCGFKRINDTFGHAEGDEALKAVGRIIQESVSQKEIAARTGGDEFIIILYRENQNMRAKEIVDAINEKADVFNKQNKKDYQLIFSIGVYTEKMTDQTLDYFLAEADKRMYEHKRAQKLGR